MKTISTAAFAASLVLSSQASAATLIVYTNNFDAPATTAAGVTAAGFTNGVLDPASAGAWNANGWQGHYFLNNSPTALTQPASQLTLTGLPAHDSVSIAFLLGFLESWDSTNGLPGTTPDFLDLYLDGVQIARLTTSNAFVGNVEDYDGGTELFDFPANINLRGSDDALVDMSTSPALNNVAHSASSLTFAIQASGQGWQGFPDESWGIDSVRVSVNTIAGAVPEPASWAMLILGFGAVGYSLRSSKGRKALQAV